MDFRNIDELAQQLSGFIPADLHAVRADVEHNVKAALQAWARKLDVVTREEFEVQKKVLLRTREKLEALEALIEAKLPTKIV
jgi:ubiquinone biosynthesis accessory factor UbiK